MPMTFDPLNPTRRRFTTPYQVGTRSSASLLGGNNALDAVNNEYAASQWRDMNEADDERARQLGEAENARREEIRRYNLQREEERRRFDVGREDTAARRAQFDNLMQMLFGGGAPAQGGGGNALRSMAWGGGAPVADDGIDRRSINNSLARYIRDRM